jgi:hydrogenase nickel incorporation protein HypA/HybF
VHELSICSAIAQIAADAADGRAVDVVRIDVGHLRQVVPDTLRYCWDVVVDDTSLAGARLEVRDVPASVFCPACSTTTVITTLLIRCGTCESTDVELRSGDELSVVSLDLRGP